MTKRVKHLPNLNQEYYPPIPKDTEKCSISPTLWADEPLKSLAFSYITLGIARSGTWQAIKVEIVTDLIKADPAVNQKDWEAKQTLAGMYYHTLVREGYFELLQLGEEFFLPMEKISQFWEHIECS